MLLLSITYGNIDVQNCLRNIVSLFHHVEKEMAWRKAQRRDVGFQTLQKSKPLVAVGPEHPLADQILMADFFREYFEKRFRCEADQKIQMVVMDLAVFMKL